MEWHIPSDGTFIIDARAPVSEVVGYYTLKPDPQDLGTVSMGRAKHVRVEHATCRSLGTPQMRVLVYTGWELAEITRSDNSDDPLTEEVTLTVKVRRSK